MLYENIILIIFLYFLVGAFAGTASGLLGMGGGIIVVPGLAWLFHYQHFDSNIVMHLAVGTSLAVMIMTTLRAIYAHRRYRIRFWSEFRGFLPGLIVGVVAGAVLGHYLHSRLIAIIFAAVVLVIALYMFFPRPLHSERQLPASSGKISFGSVVGGFSGLLGIGGSVLMIPYLTYCNVSMREAVLISIATGFTVAIVGTVSVIITGMFASDLPAWSTGYVYWPAWFAVAFGSILFVPLGTRLSHRLPTGVLRRLFAVFLLLVGIHLLMR